MLKRVKPDSAFVGEEHLHDEQMMDAIEKDILKSIHRQIWGRWYRLRSRTAYAIAASLLLFCTAGYLFLHFNSKAENIKITANSGHISLITLPDGSRVWLNSGSTLSYPAAFGKIRRVELVNGEAFFDIKHDVSHPFIVNYGNLHAQVLGTSFNIKYYKKLNDVRITVVTGLVEVGNQKQSFGLISPDKEIIYDQKTSHHNSRVINSHKVAAWKAKEVNLYDVPFEDLMLTIENVYSVKVKYDQETMKNVVTTIHFSSSDDLKQVLEIIKTIHGLNYTINGKEVDLEHHN